jgi:hypothetical protein
MTHHEAGEEYAGSATLSSAESTAEHQVGQEVGLEVAVEVTLRGAFQPIDGRFHWYGRVTAPGLDAVGSGASVVLRTPYGVATGRLSDLDPWGRMRVTGTGRPPF